MSPRARRARLNIRLIGVLLLGLAGLTGLLAGGYYGRKWYTASQALRAGREAFSREDWATAARQFKIYLSKYPESDPAVLAEYIRATLAIRPRTTDALVATASAYRILLRIRRDDIETYERLVRVYGRLGDTSNALQTANRWLTADPDSTDARLWIARSQIAQKDYLKAESGLEGLVRAHPDQVEAYSMLAAIAVREGTGADGRHRAQAWVNEAVAKNPKSAEALIARASLARLGPDAAAAQASSAIRADLQAAASLEPADPYLWLALCNEWFGLGELDQARDAVQKGKDAFARSKPDELDDPEDWPTALYLQEGAIALADRDAAAAARLADAALADIRQPNSRRVLLPIVVRSYLIGRNAARAEQLIGELEELVPPDRRTDEFARELEFLRAAIAAGTNEPLTAATRLETLVARAPEDVASWRLLAVTLSETGQPRRAARAWRQCLRLAPGDSEVLLALARELARASDWGALESLIASIPEGSRTAEHSLLSLRARLGLRARTGLSPGDAATLRAQANTLNAPLGARLDLYLTRAMIEENANDFPAAERILRVAVDECPSEAFSASVELTRFLLRRGRHDDAAMLAATLCEQFASNPQSWVLQADVAAARQNPDDERSTLERGLKVVTDPTTRRVLELRRVSADLRLGNLADAASRLETIVDTASFDLSSLVALLNVRMSQKEWALAQAAVDRIRKNEGDAGIVWRLHQARLWFELDWRTRTNEIEDLLIHVIAADAEAVEAIGQLGLLYERQGQWKRAEETYRKGLVASNGSEFLAVRLMGVLETVGRGSETQGVLDLVPSDAANRDMFRLRAAINSADLTEAISQLKTQVDRDPQNWRARVLQARLIYQLPDKNAGNALALLDEADQIADTPIESVSARIAVLLDQGRQPEALDFLNRLVAKLESFEHVLLRAALYAQVGRFDDAAADYRKLPALAKGAEGHLALAKFLIGMAQYAEALATIEDGLKRVPDDPALARMKILALVRRGEPADREAALALIDPIEKAVGEDAELLSFRATIALASGPAYREKAEALLERLVTLMPRRSEAHAQLAYIALERGDLVRARERVARGVAVSADDPMLAMARARIELVARKPEAAIEFARAALRSRPNDLDARRLFVECAVNGGAELARSALEDANRWVNEMPDDATAHLARSDLLVAAGDTEAAIADLETFLAKPRNADDVGVRLAVAGLLRSGGSIGRAEGHVEHAERIAPATPAVLVERFRCLAAAKRFDDLAARLTELDPAQSAEALLLGANLLAESAETASKAVALLEAAAAKSARRAEFLFELAGIHFRLGQTEDAAAAYERVLEELPAHGESLNNLAWILSEYRHDYHRALDLADRALAADGKNPHFHDTRAAILEKLPNRRDEAVAACEKAAQLATSEPSTAAKAWLRAARILAKSDPAGAKERAQRADEIDRDSRVLDDAQRAEIAGILNAGSTDK